MLSVTYKPFMLSVIILNVVMLNVVMLNVVMLIVVAPEIIEIRALVVCFSPVQSEYLNEEKSK